MQHLLHAPDLPIAAITVFTDRAEVKRVISLNLAKGRNDVVVEYIAQSTIGDSIRVDGRGNAVIGEVQFKEEYLEEDEISNKKVDGLKKALDALCAEKKAMDNSNALNEKQLTALYELIKNASFKNLGKNVIANDGGASHVEFDRTAEKNIEKLYEFYKKKSLQLQEEIQGNAEQVEDLQTRIDKAERELEEAEKSAVKNSVVIMLQNEEEGNNEVELTLTYQVRQARWTPSYDVRVNTMEQDKEQRLEKVQLTFFGNIRQESGEDWNNATLTLSTAQPGARQLPKLGTTFAKFVQPEPPKKRYQTNKVDEEEEMEEAPSVKKMVTKAKRGYKAAAPKMAVETSTPEHQPIVTAFDIPQPKTILSDNNDHEVTIALLDFASVPRFDCVPSKCPTVYLSAAATNSSEYPLLAGTASVYMNNCFMQKVRIDEVAVGEHVNIPLGVYPAVKVTYKPAHKYHRQTGVLNKTAVQVHEQRIQLKNTKGTSRTVTIVEPVPKTTDENIKIRLVSPELTPAEPNKENKWGEKAVLNADNNLEWTVLVPGGGQAMELLIKWEVEYPPNEQLQFKEAKH